MNDPVFVLVAIAALAELAIIAMILRWGGR